MDNLVPILLYIRNFREYRHRDCRDASPRFVGRESSRHRTRNRSSVSTSSPSSSSFSSTAAGKNSIGIGRSPSFRYKMQQVGEEIKELEKDTSPEIERSSRVDIKSPTVNHIDSKSSDHHLEDQDYDDYSKLTSLEDEELTENFQMNAEDSDDTDGKYRQILLANTLLDNERQVYSFEVDNIRDEYSTLEDEYLHERRLLRDKTRIYDLLTRDYAKLKDSCLYLEHCISQRDSILEKNGLSYLQLKPFRSFCDIKTVAHCGEDSDDDFNGDEFDSGPLNSKSSVVLFDRPSSPIDQFVISFFNQYDQSTLESKLKELISEKVTLNKAAEKLREDVKCKRQENHDLEEKVFTESYNFIESSDIESLEAQKENIRLLKEYRNKLSCSNEEIKRLKDKLTYLESELDRLKSRHHNAEFSEIQLNKNKRQSLRKLREVEAKIGELEGLNNLLYKKLDKMKKSKYVVS